MPDIELVIKLPKDMYEWVNDINKLHADFGISDFIDIIKNGTLLPEGHGDLIDRDEVHEVLDNANLSLNCSGLLGFVSTVIPTDK